jgi:hypothetical protein
VAPSTAKKKEEEGGRRKEEEGEREGKTKNKKSLEEGSDGGSVKLRSTIAVSSHLTRASPRT